MKTQVKFAQKLELLAMFRLKVCKINHNSQKPIHLCISLDLCPTVIMREHRSRQNADFVDKVSSVYYFLDFMGTVGSLAIADQRTTISKNTRFVTTLYIETKNKSHISSECSLLFTRGFKHSMVLT